MPVLIPSEVRCRTRHMRDFGGLYGGLILLSFHAALVVYINSSFLEQFFSQPMVSVLYTIGSALSVFTFLVAPRILAQTGNTRLMVLASVVEFCTLLAFPFASSPLWVAFLFTAHLVTIPLMFFSLDIFMEAMIGNCEGETGGRRGLFLTITSLTVALSALLTGYLIGDTVPHYTLVYVTSAVLLIPFVMTVLRSFRTFRDETYDPNALTMGMRTFWHIPDIRNVCLAHFLLQLFFAWMVVYTPVYLHTVIGFNWHEIGQILFVGLMAYVLLEYIIGVIADSWLGEKEMMAAGFLIIAVSTSWFTFLEAGEIGLFMVTMFMTRVGASLIEATTESYFFKHTTDRDTALISFFRITRPLSYLVGAVLGSLTLSFLSANLLFVVLGFLMIPGLFFTMALKDTR